MYQLTLIKREFFGSSRFTILFITNLCIGLLGFTVLDAFKRDFSDMLMGASKSMLTADFEVQARRPFTKKELTVIRDVLGNSKEVHKRTLYSMALSPTNQSLSQIVAIGHGYPMYGYIDLRKKGRVETSNQEKFLTDSKAWLEESLCIQLGLNIGDTFKLGHSTLTVDDIIEDESAMKWQGSSLAPRIYINHKTLESAKLVTKGSIVRYSHLFRLPQPNPDLESAQKKLDIQLDDPQIRVRSHISAGQANGRILKYLSDYLSLVALTALALAGLGSSYLFRSYLSQKRKEIAILLSVGLTHKEILFLYLTKLSLLGAVAATLSFAITSAILPFIGRAIEGLTPLEFTPSVSITTLLYTFCLAVGYAIVICLPVMSQIKTIKPSELFQEDLDHYRPNLKRTFILLIPAILGFYLMAIFQSNSIFVGSIFVASILAISILFMGIGMLIIRTTSRIQTSNISIRLSLRYIQRKQLEFMLGFLALAIASTLISLIPSIRSSIENEVRTPDGQKKRSLFMFDIQEEQKEPLEDLVKNFGVKPLLSPMIRARLAEINDKPFKKSQDEGLTRESQRNNRMRNRGVNLSYRNGLGPSESIVAGRNYKISTKPSEPYEMTIEERYADRIGIKLHDKLTFNIQSIPITAVVVGLRKVKWNSFDPNFFIQFQPGSLNDAPKTFVAAVPDLPNETKLRLQRSITKEFPNISIIDVSKLLDKILIVVNQMSWTLLLMAALSVFSGFIVLFSIANHQAQLRQSDTNLLKVLGLSFKNIQMATLFEFLMISGTASLAGTATSIILAATIDKIVFAGTFSINPTTPLFLFFSITCVSLLTSWAATRRRLNQKPALYLN